MLIALLLLGSSALPATEMRMREYAMQVAGWGFDLVNWEISALAQKARALVIQPATEIPAPRQESAVVDYLARAAQIGQIERELDRQLVAGGAPDAAEAIELQAQLMDLRGEQSEARPAVEQILQGQVKAVLEDAGFGVAGAPFPPVQFTFTEPPKKLVVSPRARIETIYGQMLAPGMSLAAITGAEQGIDMYGDVSAYITDIGGLGAFPTMVVDQASLEWVLSTIAHEWTHNYLVFFPLGWSYFASGDMTTMNETVAEIVGNETGAVAMQQDYPDLYVPDDVVHLRRTDPILAGNAFSFDRAMQETRLKVDELLAAGKVDEAEQYMEERRQTFAEHGYPLRVLNQAYFAFHGSYGTTGASTSPIGPKLERLRELMPDLRTFLHTVRWFTSPADLDAALAKWEAQAHAPK